jgi:hypothetical protein
MKKIARLLPLLLLACTTIETDRDIYITLGRAKIEECKQISIYPDKETIKFDCKKMESEGLSAEFVTIIQGIAGVLWPF